MENDENDDYTIDAYMYNRNWWLSHITRHIYPFWKKEFIAGPSTDSFNPFASWTLSEVVQHNMGLKDNTLCLQLVICDIPIGFCCVLLLDEFDKSDRMSPFSHEMYQDSAVLYNFVLDKPFRGGGYGTKLLQATIQYLISNYQNKYKYLTLYVNTNNKGAIKLYEKHKFTHMGPNPTNQTNEAIYKSTLFDHIDKIT